MVFYSERWRFGVGVWGSLIPHSENRVEAFRPPLASHLRETAAGVKFVKIQSPLAFRAQLFVSYTHFPSSSR